MTAQLSQGIALQDSIFLSPFQANILRVFVRKDRKSYHLILYDLLRAHN